jgi:hypothetical protein
MRYGGDMVQYHCKALLTLCNVPRDKRLRTAPVVIPGMSMASRAACRCASGAMYREISGFAPPPLLYPVRRRHLERNAAPCLPVRRRVSRPHLRDSLEPFSPSAR